MTTTCLPNISWGHATSPRWRRRPIGRCGSSSQICPRRKATSRAASPRSKRRTGCPTRMDMFCQVCGQAGLLGWICSARYANRLPGSDGCVLPGLFLGQRPYSSIVYCKIRSTCDWLGFNAKIQTIFGTALMQNKDIKLHHTNCCFAATTVLYI